MSSSPADTARWRSEAELKSHFNKHRHKMSIQSISNYDTSARATIRVGKRFTYLDPDWGQPRVGYYAVSSNKLTVLDDTESQIKSHFIPRRGEHYVRGLPQSSYQ